MKNVLNPPTYWSLNTVHCIVYWLCDCNSNNYQLLDVTSSSNWLYHKKIGSKASVLAVAILEFHQDSIACIFSMWAIVGRHRGGASGGKNNYWPYFLSKSFTHQQAQQKGLSSCIVITKWKMGSRWVQRQAVWCIYLSFVSFWTEVDTLQFEAEHSNWWYQFCSSCMSCRWMCCSVSVGCNQATCWLSHTEMNTEHSRYIWKLA